MERSLIYTDRKWRVDRIKIMIVAGITKSRSERSVHIVTLLDKKDGMIERASK